MGWIDDNIDAPEVQKVLNDWGEIITKLKNVAGTAIKKAPQNYPYISIHAQKRRLIHEYFDQIAGNIKIRWDQGDKTGMRVSVFNNCVFIQTINLTHGHILMYDEHINMFFVVSKEVFVKKYESIQSDIYKY